MLMELLFSRYVVSNSCDPMDCSLPGSSVYGISQARILEKVVIFFSRGGLPYPGIEPVSPILQVDSLHLSGQGSPHVSVRRGPNPSRVAGIMNLELED